MSTIVMDVVYTLSIEDVNNTTRFGCMNDSAGKFCPDKWTREGEEGKVEGKRS